MQKLVIALFSLHLSGCSDHLMPSQETLQPVSSIPLDSKEPQFRFTGPEGFEWNAEYRLWRNRRLRASITVAHSPDTSFDSVADDFVPDRMLASNLEMLTKETREIDGQSKLIVRGNRLNSKYPQQFCTVAFPTKTGCAQLTAIYPADTASGIKANIEQALLSARYETP